MDFSKLVEWFLLFEVNFYAFLGAFVLYLLNRLHNRQPFSILKPLNINIGPRAKPRIILLDMLISSILGSVIVVQLTSPATNPQALVAGLGMTGILSAHAKSNN